MARTFNQNSTAPWIWVMATLAGVALSVLINFWIVMQALEPLHDLRLLVDDLQAGNPIRPLQHQGEADPDIASTTETIYSLVTKLEERNQQLRALSRRAINAQEEERKRIARSLHDDTGQALSMLILHLGRLKSELPPEFIAQHERLDNAHQLAVQTLGELRKIVYGLRPTILDDLGLVPAIRWYARTNLEELGVQVEIEAPDDMQHLPAYIKSTCYRIAQEAINNIVRHARASTVQIRLTCRNEIICLQVRDDGRGFNVEKTSEQALQLQQMGLLGIQERAELVEGWVWVDSAPGKGTRVEVCLPLATKEAVPMEALDV